MTEWVQIDRVLRDWDRLEVEPWERRLLSQTEVEQRFLRRREREQEEGRPRMDVRPRVHGRAVSKGKR